LNGDFFKRGCSPLWKKDENSKNQLTGTAGRAMIQISHNDNQFHNTENKKMKRDAIRTIQCERVIAILRGVDRRQCMPVAEALYTGGIRVLEIPYEQKNPDSWPITADCISTLAKAFAGRLLVGAGTVTNERLVKLTAEAGGQFVVSPDSNADVIACTGRCALVSIPGAMTPTEILGAYRAGADIVKVFPAGRLGPGYLRAVRAPIDHVPLMAVGGIDAGNIAAFLAAGAVGAGVGGNLVNLDWIARGRFDLICEAAKKIVAAAEGDTC
jgi:2-dehydro-3-deoxyphosphogluconate aldolase/(4S)-4-hydroxy-2-oxoglutarate aldolase